MKFVDLLQTASASMFRSKARTFLTVIAIFIGAMTITLTNGIGTGIKSYLNKQIGNLGATNLLSIQVTPQATTGPTTSTSAPALYDPNQQVAVTDIGRVDVKQLLMTSKDINTIKSIPNILSAVPDRSVSPDYIAGTGKKYQLSINQQFGNTTAPMIVGQGVNNNSAANQVTIPENYVSVLGYSTNQAIIGKAVSIGITNAEGTHSVISAIVVGVEQKAILGSSTAYANTTLSNALYNFQSTGLPAATVDSFSTVVATFPNDLTTIQINNLKSQLTTDGYTGLTIKDRENIIFTAINVVIIVFDMFGVIALLAASFGIINTLFMSVQERTKEIGLMKALGMSPRKIFTLFSIEAILIGFWGSLLGVGFASLLGKLINTVAVNGFLKGFPGLTLLTFPISTIATVMLGIMLIAFIAGTLPAYRASKKDPIDALRYE